MGKIFTISLCKLESKLQISKASLRINTEIQTTHWKNQQKFLIETHRNTHNSKYIKIYSVLLVKGEMYIKTTMRFISTQLSKKGILKIPIVRICILTEF